MKYLPILIMMILAFSTALLTACNNISYPSSGAIYYYDQKQIPMNIIQTPDQL